MWCLCSCRGKITQGMCAPSHHMHMFSDHIFKQQNINTYKPNLQQSNNIIVINHWKCCMIADRRYSGFRLYRWDKLPQVWWCVSWTPIFSRHLGAACAIEPVKQLQAVGESPLNHKVSAQCRRVLLFSPAHPKVGILLLQSKFNSNRSKMAVWAHSRDLG